MDKKSLLEWYADAGVDEAIDGQTTDYFAQTPPRAVAAPLEEKPKPASAPVKAAAALQSPSAAAASARALADHCLTMEQLEEAVRGFDGCPLKKNASKTIFGDGNPKARVMVIGEAPGAEEDLQGIPFCGPSGKLLDKMLASIGLDRTSVYITNTVYWRPPGNRQPSAEEMAICLPLVERHIALVNPKLLILSGGVAVSDILAKELAISRLRGKLYEYSNIYMTAPVTTAVTYHPSYLLRSPAQKRLAWSDMLMIRKQLSASA